MRRRIVAAAIIAAGLATAGIAYAENQPPDPSVAVTRAAATGAQNPAAAGGKSGMLKGAIHGDLLVRNRDGSTKTVTFDRGKISAISASAITIERPDGASVSKDINDQTVFNGTDRDKLTSGMPVIVVSEGQTATHIVSKGARLEKRQQQLEKRRQRLQERLERRKDRLQERRRAEPAPPATPAPPAGSGAPGDPGTKPSSAVDDGLATIVS
jgi:hypothetical protein